MSATQNLYLLGEHEPIHHETTAEKLSVTGELPADLHGMFVRNSPNPQFEPMGRYHWFDGDGMVHGVRLDGGKASYVNKWVRTKAFKAEEAAGKPLWTGIMEPVKPNGLKDTANTDLVVHNGRLYALWWQSGTPCELSTTDLSTVGEQTFGGKLTGGFSAHPKVDPRTGEMVFMDYSIVRPPYLRYGVVSATGELLQYVPIEVPIPHILHDIAITENYTLLLDLPLGWDPQRLKEGKRRIGFDRDSPMRIGVIPRHGDNASVRWFEAKGCYVYHTINAYEAGDEIVLVGCRVADPIPKQQDTKGRVARLDFIELVPSLYEWRMNLKTGAVHETQLDDLVTEFPRVHDGRQGQKLRYSYNPRVAARPDLMFDALVKYDLTDNSNQQWEFDAGWYGSEAVFVPRPNAVDEDDGYLVTCLSNAATQESQCVVLNAQDVAKGPIARVKLPHRIPIGFHTTWVPQS